MQTRNYGSEMIEQPEESQLVNLNPNEVLKCFLDQDNYTALHIAAKEGHEEVASVLLEHGASLGKHSGGKTEWPL